MKKAWFYKFFLGFAPAPILSSLLWKKIAMKIIRLQKQPYQWTSQTISSTYESTQQYSTAVSSLKSFSERFFVDWTPALENSYLRACSVFSFGREVQSMIFSCVIFIVLATWTCFILNFVNAFLLMPKSIKLRNKLVLQSSRIQWKRDTI